MTPQPQQVAEQIEFRKTVVMGLNAMTQMFVQQRQAFTLEAMAESGLDPKDWQPNFELGVFVSVRKPAPVVESFAPQGPPTHLSMFDRNGIEPAHLVADEDGN